MAAGLPHPAHGVTTTRAGGPLTLKDFALDQPPARHCLSRLVNVLITEMLRAHVESPTMGLVVFAFVTLLLVLTGLFVPALAGVGWLVVAVLGIVIVVAILRVAFVSALYVALAPFALFHKAWREAFGPPDGAVLYPQPGDADYFDWANREGKYDPYALLAPPSKPLPAALNKTQISRMQRELGTKQFSTILDELLDCSDLSNETRGDIASSLSDYQYGQLDLDDYNYIIALHARLIGARI
ncbi:MAG TPA: hypothetical protein VHG92_06415 [Afifellaceae bacterium]|nr:hypothetical protein [Afifellaceae bacterium]